MTVFCFYSKLQCLHALLEAHGGLMVFMTARLTRLTVVAPLAGLPGHLCCCYCWNPACETLLALLATTTDAPLLLLVRPLLLPLPPPLSPPLPFYAAIRTFHPNYVIQALP